MDLSDIPLPPSQDESQAIPPSNDAWMKAQEALRVLQASAPKSQSKPQVPQPLWTPPAFQYAKTQFHHQPLQTAAPRYPISQSYNSVPPPKPVQHFQIRPTPVQNTQNNFGPGTFKPFKMNIHSGGNSYGRGSSLPQQSSIPPSLKSYLERARAAIEPQDEAKLTSYLDARIKPMIDSGAARWYNWEKEPLPHEVNFELKKAWVPARQTPGFVSKTPVTPSRPHISPRRRRASSGSPEDSFKKVRSNTTPSPPPTHKKKEAKEKKTKHKKRKSSKQPKEQVKHLKRSFKKDIKWVAPVITEAQKARLSRFSERPSSSVSAGKTTHSNVVKFDASHTIKGLCQNIEKAFFRLTTAPDPAQIRPVSVLQKSLAHVKQKYIDGAEYSYLTSQLRSIRQDLTVQLIKNSFAVMVYETNARICLENKDIAEFNQCQNQLSQLYQVNRNSSNEAEFIGYRLLYYIYLESSTDITSLLKLIETQSKTDECLAFALTIRKILANSNYPKFFKFIKRAPRMCGYLVDLFVDRERRAFLSILFKAHRTSIGVDVLARWLGFNDNPECLTWLLQFDVYATDCVIDMKKYSNKEIA